MKIAPATKKMLFYTVGGFAILSVVMHLHHLHKLQHIKWVAKQRARAAARHHAWKKHHPSSWKHHDGFMKTRREFVPSWATKVATAEAAENNRYHEMAVHIGRTAM